MVLKHHVPLLKYIRQILSCHLMVVGHKQSKQRKRATINSVAACMMYCMKQDCFGNVVKLASETKMKQVSCDPAPLCQGDMLKIRKARLDVIIFLSLLHLCIYSFLSAQLLSVSGWPDTLPQMLQDQSQLACGGFCVFHISIVTLCSITGRYLVVIHPKGSFKAHCCCDLIAWQVTNRLIPQPLLRTQEMLWIVLCLFLCAPGNNFLVWVCYPVVSSYVWWCLSGDFLICFLVFN